MRILVLGATGMLGYQVFRLGIQRRFDIHAIVRNKAILLKRLGHGIADKVDTMGDAKDFSALEKQIEKIAPDWIINCIGIIKQSPLAENHYESIAINSFLPHQLEKYSQKFGCSLLHISTDCVFNGMKGPYKEADPSDATDLYGKTKYLGEVGYGKGITLRTSIIGHEITDKQFGLLSWYLSQQNKVFGFTKAIFSGFTTYELSNLMFDIVLPGNLAAGVYQVASTPISKYELLKIISDTYGRRIEIEPSSKVEINRALDGSRFSELTGYIAPSWVNLIASMKLDYNNGF